MIKGIIEMKLQWKNFFRVSALLLVLILLLPGYASSKTVSLPLSIDYPLLRSLFINCAFTDPDQTSVVLDENNGCRKIKISEPIFTEENARVRFETKLQIHIGTNIGNTCLMPIEWEGYLALFMEPRIDSNEWVLSFDTVDSALYDKNHETAHVAGIVWTFAKPLVYDYLNNITINLAPPVSEVQSFLSSLFSPDLDLRAKKMISSFRPGKIVTTPDAVRVAILADIEELYEKDEDIEQEVLSEEERQKFIEIWEAWDPFLVHMITLLSKEPLSDDDRQILLDALLEARYSFITEPLDGTVNRDFVRDQFITAWSQLSPVFRHHLSDVPCKATLGYLAFFTASDALSALDEIGPTLGIEISRNGLIRLARLLGARESEVLAYSPGTDLELREVLGLGLPPDASGPAFDVDELEIDTEETSYGKNGIHQLLHAVMPIYCTTAWAAEKNDPANQLDTMKQWIVPKENLTPYLEKIKTLLQDTSSDVLRNGKIAEKYHDLYRQIVLSATWQESCFRQFKVRKGKVTYLRSYNNTSVGLMQINERVWRGMYDANHLRWDINYNARAGCEIIDLYFRRYALRKMEKMKLEKPLDNDTIARLMYAMYNGGPGQFHKFLKRGKKGKYYLSDKLFFEKYSWVKNNQWDNISKCLIGSS